MGRPRERGCTTRPSTERGARNAEHVHYPPSHRHYLLSHGNIDFPMVSRALNTLDPASAFAPLQPLHDSDIEGHLRHAHEQTIISAIEEGRRATVRNFYKTLELSMRKDWERQKEAVFEELGRHAPSSSSSSSNAGGALVASTSSSSGIGGTGGASGSGSGSGRRSLGGRDAGFGETSSPARQNGTLPQGQSAGSQLQMHTRMMRYDRTTRKLNEYRKQGIPLAIVNAYSEASLGGSGSASDSVSRGLV